MSRYSLKPLPDRADLFEVAVGWDSGFGTFFVTVFGEPDCSHELDLHLWSGTHFREIPTIDALLASARNYAELPVELINQLLSDRDARPHDPTRPVCRILAQLGYGEADDK